MRDETYKTHPSYVVVGFSRCSNSGINNGATFFGSKIKSSAYISLTIKRASVRRELSQDYIYGDEQLLELRLSPNQFAELLTSMNCGNGVPATLEYYNKERVENPPFESELETFKKEIEDTKPQTDEMLAELNQTIDEIKLSKRDADKLRSVVTRLRNVILGHIPFVAKSAYQSIEKAVVEAKGAIDLFYTGLLTRLGVKALQDKATIELLEGKDK